MDIERGAVNWSDYQKDIFSAVSDSSNSLIIEAVAGSGKTTTIVEAIRHVPLSQSVAFLAFNKSIATELQRRVQSPNAKCMTLHSAGFNAWRSHLSWDAQGLSVDSRKTSKIMDEILDDQTRWAFAGEMGRLISVAKNSGLVTKEIIDRWSPNHTCLLPDDLEEWFDLVDFYALDSDKWDENGIEVARKVLTESVLQSKYTIDYDDMLYMPIIADASFEKYDVIFLDEAQDVSGIQVEMVDRMRAGSTRVIAVGDPHQAIYGFRGALSDSMEQIAKRFHSEHLPLSVSYRCPKKVVETAQTWVPQIEYHTDSPDGLVQNSEPWIVKDFRVGDAVLCRNARPVVELAFKLIRNKIPAKVLGRDIGQGLIKLIDKMKALDIQDLEEKLQRYRQKEVVRAKGDLAKIAAIDDKLDTITVFIDEQGLNGTIPALKFEIEKLFGESSDGARMVTLATVHKSKGLEWDRVFILDADQYMPSKWAKLPWQRQQEQNIQYVAVTRARRELHWIRTEAILDDRIKTDVPEVETEKENSK